MRIFQLLSTIAYGDAVSNDTVAMEKAIKQMGYQTRIYAESIVPPLDKKTALAISELKDVSNDDIIIFHMSTGSRLNFDVAKYPCRKIVVYHNITPPEYFKNNDERFSDICEYGLKGAKSLADKVDYCLAVSEFNKKDLLNMGYKCPIDVLPIIIPMADYDKAPDKSVVKKYSDDYVNILFTGRIAPNKKQENLISAFYYYNRLYNKKSRLILAGSFRYDDPYYIRLTEYTKKLGMGGTLLGPIAVAAYSYMSLVPVIQPPIMKALTTKKERLVRMPQLRPVTKIEKILFPIIVTLVVVLILPTTAPLVGMLMLGNLFRECGVVKQLTETASNALMYIVVILLGTSVGASTSAEAFLKMSTLKIVFLGLVAFAFGTAAGVLFGKLMCWATKGKVNPLIGSAGVSAVPMAARVSQKVGSEADPSNFLLMHAMGPNVAGVIGTAVAAGTFMAMFGVM